MKKCRPKSICSGRKKTKEWIGRKVFDCKTGESEWKMKRDQETRNYRKKPLKAEHLYKPKRGKWTKDFKLLVNNFEKKREKNRRDNRKEEKLS
jgi:hypothetical protein